LLCADAQDKLNSLTVFERARRTINSLENRIEIASY
jgi:hypothetical protein